MLRCSSETISPTRERNGCMVTLKEVSISSNMAAPKNRGGTRWAKNSGIGHKKHCKGRDDSSSQNKGDTSSQPCPGLITGKSDNGLNDQSGQRCSQPEISLDVRHQIQGLKVSCWYFRFEGNNRFVPPMNPKLMFHICQNDSIGFFAITMNCLFIQRKHRMLVVKPKFHNGQPTDILICKRSVFEMAIYIEWRVKSERT